MSIQTATNISESFVDQQLNNLHGWFCNHARDDLWDAWGPTVSDLCFDRKMVHLQYGIDLKQLILKGEL